MIRDPAGLLSRIPELEPFCSEPRIRAAVESGDSFKVYRALRWARWTGRLVAHRRTLDLLLRNRRAFAKPMTGSPTLRTVNSVGATLLGCAEKEADGTYIATHAFVILFAVPLFPFGAYLVADGEKGRSASWHILARVPLGAGWWLVNRVVVLAVIAMVAGAGVAAVWSMLHRDLTIVNGLDVPVRARIDREARDVPPSGTVTLSVPLGTHRASAASVGEGGGVEVEAFQLPVSVGGGMIVWNLAGAAPVFEVSVEYFAKAAPAGHRPPEPRFHCGDRVFEARGVDDAFRSPPQTISMSQSASKVSRRHLDVAREPGVPGWLVCANLLLGTKREADALRVLEARGAARGWDRDGALLVMRIAATVSPQEGERVARIVRAALPDETLVHRVYQDTLDAAGKTAEIVKEYGQRAAAAPGSPAAQYLHARLLEGPEQRAAAEAALVRFPTDPDVLRFVLALRAEARDWAGAAALYPALRDASPEQAVQVISEAAAALSSLGRRTEALREVASLFEVLPAESRAEPAVLYARLARHERGVAPDTLVRRLEGEGPALLIRARAGLPLPEAKDPDALSATAVYRLATRDPAAAIEALKTLPAAVGFQLDHAVWALLWCEAARVGSPAEATLQPLSLVSGRRLEALRRYVRGEAGAALPNVTLELRAAAEFVRSRNASVPPAERSRLRAAARADDPVATYVTEAMARWPATAR